MSANSSPHDRSRNVASSPPLTPDHSPPSMPSTLPFPTTADFFALPPTEALKLLGASVEALARITGDVPPTPPPKDPHMPNMRGLQAEKESLARSRSEKNLARARALAEERERARPATSVGLSPPDGCGRRPEVAEGDGRRYSGASRDNREDRENQEHQVHQAHQQHQQHQEKAARLSAYHVAVMQSHASATAGIGPLAITPVDGVHLRGAAISPVSPPSASAADPLSPYIVIGADSEPLNLQHSAITRKFYSKNEPPISIAGYLTRMHQYCPMSTAVYLATSLYIHRLAVVERAIPVTRRNAHRLILAGLRVAMKALEDLSYPHAKMAKVGGVSAAELARLEINFCFLAGFELVVREDSLMGHWAELRAGRATPGMGGEGINLAAMAIPAGRMRRREGGEEGGGIRRGEGSELTGASMGTS